MPPRDPFLATLAPRFAALAPRARAALAGLAEPQFATHPPYGGWSIAEVLEHMIVANASYERGISGAMAQARVRRGAPRPHARTFCGGLLLGALREERTRKLPAPKPYRPVHVRADVVPAFFASLEALGEDLARADGLDLRVMLASPISPLIRMNLGEALDLGVTHTERHLGQIERVRRAIGA